MGGKCQDRWDGRAFGRIIENILVTAGIATFGLHPGNRQILFNEVLVERSQAVSMRFR